MIETVLALAVVTSLAVLALMGDRTAWIVDGAFVLGWVFGWRARGRGR